MHLARISAIGIGIFFAASAIAAKVSMYPPQISDLSSNSVVVNQYNWRHDVADLKSPGGVADLPMPQITPRKPIYLSMKDAILLSLRNNPSIQSTELDRITDKFALILAHHEFEPQYTLGGTSTFTKGALPLYQSTAGVNLKTTMGTTFGVNYSNTYSGGGGPGATNFTITQPLMKGFGTRLNTIPWYDALDAENSARLGFKSSIITQVVAVIGAYRKLIEDYQSLDIQKRTLGSNALTVKQSELKLKVGQLAHSDLLQQQATYETTKLSLLQQRSSLISDYQSFLDTLGLKASAKVTIARKVDFTDLKIPSLATCIQLALKGNIDYQKTLVGIAATERAVITAKDATRWQLNLSGNFAISGQNSANQIIVVNGVRTVQNFIVQGSPSIGLTLNIPLNDIQAEQGVITAKIKLQQAKLALEEARLTLIRNVTNQVQQIKNQMMTINSSQRQVDFQRANLNATKIKYRYGRTTTFQVSTIQDQLLTQETTLVSNKMSLLGLITTLNQTLGITLDKWGIKLRY